MPLMHPPYVSERTTRKPFGKKRRTPAVSQAASFLPKTAQDAISLASVRLASSYSQKHLTAKKLDFLARAAQIDAAEAPARAQHPKEIAP